MSANVASLASLLKQTQITDDEEVLRAANAALKQSKNDLNTQHVKVVALLKLDRYDDALHALEAGGDALKSRASLEHAYALYKSGKPAAAAEIAHKNSQRAFQHVEAQASYRNEDFSRAADLYRILSKEVGPDADADLRVNSGAVDAQLEWAGQGERVRQKKPTREDLEAFETAYNAACGSIARGELAQGEVLLKRAKDLCAALEDLSEEEKQAELLPITVQQIYVLARLGKEQEAEALAQSLDTAAVSGPSTQYIAQVNKLAASQQTPNPFLAQRLVHQDLSALKSDQPFKFQSDALRQNHYASELRALKFEGTAASTREILSKTTLPSTDAFYTSVGVVNAAAHAKNETGKEALKHILPLLDQRPHDIGLILTITQLYVLSNNSASAIALLETFLSRLEQSNSLPARFAPGLVGTLVSLYRGQGRKGPLRVELAKAASYWRQQATASHPAGVTYLLKAAGSALLESSDPEHLRLAREIFTSLHDANPSDRYSAAGLLASAPESANQQQLSSLTPVDRLISSLDAAALENAGIAQPALSSTSASVSKKRPADASTSELKATKAKKIRKSRMPKDFDPNRKPDPERWLPLRDRSTYRPKNKKGKARQNLLSQGAAVTDTSESSRPATPAAEVIKQKQGGGGGGGGGKKKKKGGKW